VPSKRHSKGLQGALPDEAPSGKRTPVLSQNALAQFSAKQPLVGRPRKPKKPPLKLKASSPALLSMAKAQSKQVDLIELSSTAATSPTTLESTSLPQQSKRPANPLIFDPNTDTDKGPHKTQLILVPIMDSSRQTALLSSIDINDVFRDNFEALQHGVYSSYVQE